MRSNSCIVCAVKYDSPQPGQDHIGMFSMTRRLAPFPKPRVTYFSCTLPLPQCAHAHSTDVDSDDDELAALANLGDDFAGIAFARGTLDDVLDFTGRTVSLAVQVYERGRSAPPVCLVFSGA